MTLAVGATLTLPGLAGFVLAIGLAIDANVLVFERAREEYAENPKAGMRRALQVGFNTAWTAIIDSNVTTLLATARKSVGEGTRLSGRDALGGRRVIK